MKRKNLEILKENGFNIPRFDIVEWNNRNTDIDIKKYKGKYAIRSSSYLEDGEDNSFAGQFDTYLNVLPKDINKKVKECFNSINNKNVLDYLRKNKIDKTNLKMDVIIQKMVDSKLSGIIFTANPQGLLNETVIVVGKGLGNKIVEDRIDTTTYYYNNTDSKYYYEGKKELLNKKQIDELLILSHRIKELLGEYIDIEFAIEKDTIYILQARPITTINTTKQVILDNSNIVESYPGVSSPLTISFVKKVYSGVFRSLSLRITRNNKLIENNYDYFNNMVSSSNGRIYYKISNWYGLLETLPFHKKIIPIWQDMMGVNNKKYEKNILKISPFTRIKTFFNIIIELKNSKKNMEILNNKFIEINNEFNNSFKQGMKTKDILKLYVKIRDELFSIWDITLINDLYTFIYTGKLKKKLTKKKYSTELINEYISGISNIESLKPIKELIKLSYIKGKISKDEYSELLNNYINLYGDRNLEELKLESKTFRTNPELLNKKIREYRKDKNKLKELYDDLNSSKSINIKTNSLTKKVISGISNREISRLNRTRIYGMVRTMFIEIGKNLVKEKKIRKVEDIFYLDIKEIVNNKKINLKRIISERKKEYIIYKELPNYSRLIFSEKEFDKHHKRVNKIEKEISKNTLEGIPTSTGKAVGEAIVIDDINKKYDVKDKILITKMTDPGWVFLLATAIGVISEKGSLLSHTAIISREIKIPSIVGVEDATTIIKTGDYISMDATTGKIKIIRRRKR